MPDLPKHLKVPSRAAKFVLLVQSQLNFYRIHLMAFTIIPLIISAIMWACNTEYQIEYIDCLFVCMSSMTVTGLATINLSTLSVFQQVLLFIQMVIGSTTFVSIIMIVVRQYFFRSTFKNAVKEHQRRQRRRPSFLLQKTITRVTGAAPAPLSAFRRRFGSGSVAKEDDKEAHEMNGRDSAEHSGTPSSFEPKQEPNAHMPDLKLPEPTSKDREKKKHGGKKKQISKGMIRRVEGGGVGMVNPMGWYDTERQLEPRSDEPPALAVPPDMESERREEESTPRGLGFQREPRINEGEVLDLDTAPRILDGPVPPVFAASPPPMDSSEPPPSKTPYAGKPLTDDAFPRSKTIAFDEAVDGMDHEHHDRGMTSARDGGYFPRTATARSQRGEAGVPRTGTVSSFPRTYSLRPTVSREPDPRLSGFGGFPTPLQLVRSIAKHIAPETSRTLTRTFTQLQRTNTISGRGTASQDMPDAKEVPYISFAAVVGRNSNFKDLTEEQMEELGGVEYRALKVLLIIVITYFVFVQLAAFVIIAPYISAGARYDDVFNDQPRLVTIPWFALFQSVSAYSNTGLSLVDLSMVPFQRAYLMIVVLIILIFAGNTAFPVFLRFVVWSIYKLVPTQSRVRESLKFLLDHPRRCFVYLFPATQTWVLGFVMLSLYMTDWVSFLVLDIGTNTIASLPVGTRIAAGFLQSAAVRAAGFAIVPVNSLAPAVKVLYVIMMYISVYPVALSVRSTNVYEEKSLGLFHEEAEDEFEPDGQGAQAVAKYLGWHARRQLAFDIWWLGFALWLVCIIERHHLNEASDYEWFNIFNIIFELVSAYGTVGLSLGVGNDNYSLSGSFRKLSKLVVCAVMLRGRHRGLPVAIDRAVMLPRDFTAADEEAFEEERSRRMSRRGSAIISEEAINSFRHGSASMSHSQAIPPDASPVVSPYSARPVPLSHRRDSVPASSSQPLRREASPTAAAAGPTLGSGSGPESAPGSGPRRSSSLSAAPGSPAQLAFAFSRASGERQRSPATFRGGNGGGGLTPVRESTVNRAHTRVEDDESAIE